jgi:hypothetical protein
MHIVGLTTISELVPDDYEVDFGRGDGAQERVAQTSRRYH